MRLNTEGGISLEMAQRKRASSQVEGRISWFFSSCGGVPLELRRRPQGPAHGASGRSSLHSIGESPSGFLCNRCQGEVLLWSQGWNLRVPLQGRHGSQGSSGESTAESGLVSCGAMQDRSPLKPKKQGQASCRVDIRIGGFPLRCHRNVTPAIMF